MSQHLRSFVLKPTGAIEVWKPRSPPSLSLGPVFSLYCHCSQKKKSQKASFCILFFLIIHVSRFLLFLNVRESLMSPVKCIAFRADFQAGLKGRQSCTSVNSRLCAAFLMAQELLKYEMTYLLKTTDLISLHKNAGLVIYAENLSPHCKYWKEISICTLERYIFLRFYFCYFQKKLTAGESVMDTLGKDELF